MKKTADVRAVAAQALARVVAGRSLREALLDTSARLGDVRDRALLSALLHQGARWWLRYAAAVDELLQRPLRGQEADIRALLVLGLVQIDILRLPEYAAVAVTVEAARALGKPALAGLVNALLRRWLREREARNAALDIDAVTRHAHARWMIDALAADWPQHWQGILAANNVAAPLWLRVNRRRIARAEFAAQLASAGYACTVAAPTPDGLILHQGADVSGLPGYAQGWFSVQDGAAQQAARLLDLRDGQRVLDACAAPGGKTAHMLECADVHVFALDRDAARLPRLRENLSRLGLVAEVRAGDATQAHDWWDGRAFDRILLDAPCSASGIVRRQPDIKLHRRAADLAPLAAMQASMLHALWPMLRPGGRLVYATCSVFAAENSAPMAAFAAAHADARCVPSNLDWHAAGAGMQNLPGESGMDGFFYAIVEKHN
jgi:16S rRNA (cytosine967-C5)-methyltransferase